MLKLKKFIMPAIVVLMVSLLAGCETFCGREVPGTPGAFLVEGKPNLPDDKAEWSEFDYKLDLIFPELIVRCMEGAMNGFISKDNLEEKVGEYQKFSGPFKLTLKGTYGLIKGNSSLKGDFNSEFDTKGSDARVPGEGKVLGENEIWPIVSGYKGTWSGKYYSTNIYNQNGNDYVTLTFEGQLVYQGFNNKNEMNFNGKHNCVVTFLERQHEFKP